MTAEEANDAIVHQRMVGTRVDSEVVVGWIRTVLHDEAVVLWTVTGKRIEVPLASVSRVMQDAVGGFEEE